MGITCPSVTTTVSTHYKSAQVEIATLNYTITNFKAMQLNKVLVAAYAVGFFTGIITASLNAHYHVVQDCFSNYNFFYKSVPIHSSSLK